MASEINVLLEKATSSLLLEVDIPYTLQIVDLIRQNDVSAKIAVQCIFTRLKDKNPNVVLMTLQVLDFVVKNCGELVHEEVCSRSSCEALEELIRSNTNDEVRSTACVLLGSWCSAFKNNPKLSAIQDLANILRAKGHEIPIGSEAPALYTAELAPHWADANCCHRCRSSFNLVKRKHHCRACGQVFCHDCSSRSSNIPKYGIEKEVRVCESCYSEINSPRRRSTGSSDDSFVPPAESKPQSESLYGTISKRSKRLMGEAKSLITGRNGDKSPSASHKAKGPKDDHSTPKKSGAQNHSGSSAPSGKTDAELREEEELQLALALSKSEAENKEKEKLRMTSSLLGGGGAGGHWRPYNNNSNNRVSSPSPPPPPTAGNASDNNPELAKYLNRSYWEQQRLQTNTRSEGSRPVSQEEKPFARAASPPLATVKTTDALQSSGGDSNDVTEFVAMFRAQLEIFVNRLKSNQSRGRPIANDTAVQSLFVNITAMHGQLLQHLQQQEAKRVWFEQLQDKLSQARDARAALEALREEHKEKIRREREEQHRIRQMQMMQKLEVMRKKKQEYLEYQRQLAVHRMAQTERQLMQQPPSYYGAMGPVPASVPIGPVQPSMIPGQVMAPPSCLAGEMPHSMVPPPGPMGALPPSMISATSLPQGSQQPSHAGDLMPSSLPPQGYPPVSMPGYSEGGVPQPPLSAYLHYAAPPPGVPVTQAPFAVSNAATPPQILAPQPQVTLQQQIPPPPPPPSSQVEAELISFD